MQLLPRDRREFHLHLTPEQDQEGSWQLRYRDSRGVTGLSTRTWGSAERALEGADSFLERIAEVFEMQEEDEADGH